MKVWLILLLLSSHLTFAQTYEEALDSCKSKFQNRFNTLQAKQMSEVLDKAYQELVTCVDQNLPGKHFPSFYVSSLTGKSFNMAELRGKVILINLWSLSCEPCVEMNILKELVNDYQDQDFLLLSFSADTEKILEKFLLDKNLNYDVIPDSEDMIRNRFKMPFGYPTNVFLNKKGEVVTIRSGGASNKAYLTAMKQEFKKIIDAELAN